MNSEFEPNPLKILLVTSELDPFAKTGGLADVSRSLPKALRAAGHDVRIALPCYLTIPQESRGELIAPVTVRLGDADIPGAIRETLIPGTDIRVYLVEHNRYFARQGIHGDQAGPYQDNLERFAFFCMAVIEGLSRGQWAPDIVHCNDWQTALLPAYVKTVITDKPAWNNMPTLFTIHNLEYQGCFPADQFARMGLHPDLFNPECMEFYGRVNVMKAGIAFASKINTVSPTYAREIQTPEAGRGLDGFLQTHAVNLTGILNGIDNEYWNPATDSRIIAQYSLSETTGKARCKSALQQVVGLPRRHVPLFGMIGKLLPYKGIELLLDSLDTVLEHDIQVVVLGVGEPEYECALHALHGQHPNKLRFIARRDDAMARQIYAGSDFYLMPSLAEPCGLNQMYAMTYGSVPIVRSTGGLADTVTDVSNGSLDDCTATGVVFHSTEARALTAAIYRALDLFMEPEQLRSIRRNGMRQDFSWERSSQAYVDLYNKAIMRP